MMYLVFLWLLVWGAMFSGPWYIDSPRFLDDPLTFFQGVRAFLPLAAIVLCLLWILAKRPKHLFRGSSMRFLGAYGLIGLLTSLFLSQEIGTSLYWAGLYLSPLLVTWCAFEATEAKASIKRLIYVNYAVFFLITIGLLPQSLRVGWGHTPLNQQYKLPLGVGNILTNGAARFALVVIIVSTVRLITQSRKWRWLWLLLLPPTLFLLTQTQSRTALLGLAVSSALFVLMRGTDWKLVFVGPVAAAVIYISGIKWRVHGNLSRLILLSGREATWERGLAQIKDSPFLGWGFHADRIMLQSEHMHNSYLHAMMQTGLVGALFFLAAFLSLWFGVARTGLFARVKAITGTDQALVMESIMIIGYMTARSLFESTAAFYGVDLLLIVPAMAFIVLTGQEPEEMGPESCDSFPETS
jgi:O-antigen ligase